MRLGIPPAPLEQGVAPGKRNTQQASMPTQGRKTANKSAEKQLVSRAGLARMKGVARSSVTRACSEGGPLHGALVGGQIDASDPLVVAWLTEPVRGPAGADDGGGPCEAGASVAAPTKAEMLALTRRKREAEARRLELANAITEGKVISRALVETHVIGLINAQNLRLLRETAQTIAVHAHSMARLQSVSVPEIKTMVRDQISRALATTKDRAVRALRSPSALQHHWELDTTKKKSRRKREKQNGRT